MAKHSKQWNCNLVPGSFLQIRFKALLSSKTNVLSVWKKHFSVFWKFLRGEVKTTFWETEATLSKLFKWKFSQRKLLRKMFSSYLDLKSECCECLKRAFTIFCKFLGVKVKTFFWESEAKRSKVFKSKFGHRKLLRKMFWSYPELKNECFERLKRAFLVKKLLSCEVETIFWESEEKRWKLLKGQFGYLKFARKWFWSCLELKNWCSERFEKTIFHFFVNFWVTKSNPFTGKVRQIAKII